MLLCSSIQIYVCLFVMRTRYSCSPSYTGHNDDDNIYINILTDFENKPAPT